MPQTVSMVCSNRDLQSPSPILPALSSMALISFMKQVITLALNWSQRISSSGSFSGRYSRVIELNPIEGEIVWEYRSPTRKGEPMGSIGQLGTHQNTLNPYLKEPGKSSRPTLHHHASFYISKCPLKELSESRLEVKLHSDMPSPFP